MSSKKDSRRNAGILLHITSLPSKFGIGDFGPEAFAFADFLSESGQKYWQVLPLNPVNPESKYSPYESSSSLAGNTLLISPDMLVEENILSRSEIGKLEQLNKGKVDYASAEKIKQQILSLAYERFKEEDHGLLSVSFKDFCNEESYWLDDYALFLVLKGIHQGQPWYEWPIHYRKRDKLALDEVESRSRAIIEEIKWYQFIFFRQWEGLKKYCNQLGVNIFGDIPFYVSYDSADVWSNPDIFSIDDTGKRTAMAGVPPDYFNENGQLWGMPVFRWDILMNRNYDWWVKRIQKNLEMFDLVRLDHFRAFSDFWEVPADSKTAKNGQWKKGPGADLFKILQKELGEIFLVAEDLGDIDEAVHKLRKEFKLPGMKVLQFGFGPNMDKADNIPHNFTVDSFVYTGTHDNNTTAGWFRRDLKRGGRLRINRYTGKTVSLENVNEVLIAMAYQSISQTAIIPLQDLLGLDESACMNIPGTTEGNWIWRLMPGQIDYSLRKHLRELIKIYDRGL